VSVTPFSPKAADFSLPSARRTDGHPPSYLTERTRFALWEKKPSGKSPLFSFSQIHPTFSLLWLLLGLPLPRVE